MEGGNGALEAEGSEDCTSAQLASLLPGWRSSLLLTQRQGRPTRDSPHSPTDRTGAEDPAGGANPTVGEWHPCCPMGLCSPRAVFAVNPECPGARVSIGFESKRERQKHCLHSGLLRRWARDPHQLKGPGIHSQAAFSQREI